MRYKGKGGIQYDLEAKPFAQGGEGQVFNIVGKPNLVAKLYKDTISIGDRERKLNVMVTYPPDKSVLNQIAWPVDVLYNGNTFIGFVMPKLKINEDLNVIYEYGSSAKYPNIPWSNKIIIAKNLCAVLNAVHEAGHACGDLNPKNISVDPNTGHIVFVDTDSYHIQDGGNTYRCCVGIPEYLPVEIQRKMKGGLSTAALPTFSKNTDNFALAVHIFQLLMNGVHPFSCAVLPSQVSVAFPQPSDNIIKGQFPFMQKVQGITIPKFAPPINILPVEIQNLFKRAFIDGHTNPNKRPSPVEWFTALSKLEKTLKTCSKVSHHEYYNNLSSCPWCDANNKFNQGIQVATIPSLTQSTIKQSMKPAYVPAPSYNSSSRSTYSNTPSTQASGSYAGTYQGSYNLSRRSSVGNKKKIIISIVIVLLIIIGIVVGVTVGTNSNNSNQKVYLSTPSSISVSNGVLTWGSVDSASSYTVKVNGVEQQVSSNSYILDSSFEAGTYTISVKAKGATDNIIASDYSTEITVVKPSVSTNVAIHNGEVSWSPVSGYTKYKVYSNNTVIATVNTTSYSLTDNADKLSSGDNVIGIVVSGDNVNTIDSNLSSTVLISKLKAPLNVSINDDTVSWQSVSNSTGYVLSITGDITKDISIDAGTTSYYLLGQLSKGNYSINVKAIGNGNTTLTSSASNACTYNLLETIIKVSTAQDLINIGNDLTAKYLMQNDIDISGSAWTPIGSIANRFTGALIGNGYSISGLTLTSRDTKGAGFFGVIGESGKVSNVTFTNVNISGGSTGYIGAVAGINYGTIFDVTVEGTVGVSNVGDNIGGLVARSFGSMYNCTNKATVKGGTNVGGIAGNFEFASANMSFNNCFNLGNVTGQTKVGGVVGYLRVSRLVYISKLSNTASVSSSGKYSGGIIGYTEGISGQTGNYESCVNSGNVTALDYAAGCFGYVGSYINITISNPADPTKECSNTGVITTKNGSNKGNIKSN